MAPTPGRTQQTQRQRVISNLKDQWFLSGVLLTIAIAYPAREYVSEKSALNPKWTLKVPGVILIFLVQGMSLKRSAVLKAVKAWRIISFSFACTFLLYPLLTFGLVELLRRLGYNDYLASGMIVLAIMPTTTAMSTILTTGAKGDVPIAIANATLGNVAGVFLSPLLAVLLLASAGTVEIDIAPACTKLAYMILGPFAVGQVLQAFSVVRQFTEKNRKRMSIFNHAVLLVIILVSFANLYQLDSSVAGFRASDIAIQIFLGLFLNWLVSLIVWFATWWLPIEKRIAAFYVSVQKTVVMGLPMCDALFGTHPMASLFSLPLILFHPAELATGSILITFLKRRVNASRQAASEQGAGEEPTAAEEAPHYASQGSTQSGEAGTGGRRPSVSLSSLSSTLQEAQNTLMEAMTESWTALAMMGSMDMAMIHAEDPEPAEPSAPPPATADAPLPTTIGAEMKNEEDPEGQANADEDLGTTTGQNTANSTEGSTNQDGAADADIEAAGPTKVSL